MKNLENTIETLLYTIYLMKIKKRVKQFSIIIIKSACKLLVVYNYYK